MAATACNTQVDWIVVETDVQDLCVVDLASEFHGNEDLSAGPDGVVSRVFSSDELGITLSEKISASMFLRGLGISSAVGVDNFDFIESLNIEVSTGNETPIRLLDYDTGDGESSDNWFVGSESVVDIAPYFEADDMQLKVDFVGTMPMVDWSASLDVCVFVQASYRESF